MDGTVAVLSMGLAPYNLLDRALGQELVAGLAWAQREGARAVILRSSLVSVAVSSSRWPAT
jgi:hypothetical protein